MKPLRIELSAWGSYPDVTFIDFTKFYEGSLFLITGPTGAGKTTIFDAISFALYGDVSGKLREKASVRSDFAKPEVDTYVELHFLHKEQEYKIRRTPKYSRPKKRGDGFTTSGETAQLSISNQPPITALQDVNRKIDEIMGINYSQFKQIAMIAQGEFLELLVSNSRDRVEIFRNLFKTERYEKMQKILSEKSKHLYANIMELKNKIDEAVSTIEVEKPEKITVEKVHSEHAEFLENMELANKIEDSELEVILKAEYPNYELIVTHTKEYVKKEKQQIILYEKQLNALSERSKSIVIAITEGENLNAQINQLQQIQQELEQLELQKEKITHIEEKIYLASLAEKVRNEERMYLSVLNRLKELKAKKETMIEERKQLTILLEESLVNYQNTKAYDDKIQLLQERKRELDSYLPLFIEVDERKAKLNEYAMLLKEKIDEYHQVKEQFVKNKEQKELLSEENLQYNEVEILIGDYNLKLAEVERQAIDIEEAIHKRSSLEEEKKKLTLLQHTFEEVQTVLKEKKEHYDKNELLYKSSAIGLVAKFLEEDKPCPVCGSLNHPKKAVISHDVPDEEKLDKLKQEYEKEQSIYQNIYQEASKQNGIVATKISEYEQTLNKLKINDECIKEVRDEVIKSNKEYKKSLADLSNKLLRKEQIQKQLTKIEQLLKQYETQMEEKKLFYEAKKSEFDVLKGTFEEIVKKLPEGYTSKSVKAEQLTIKQQVDDLCEKQKKAEIDYQNKKIKLENKNTLLEDTKIEEDKLTKEVTTSDGVYKASRLKVGFETEESYRKAFLVEDEIRELELNVKNFYEHLKEKENTKNHLTERIKENQKVDLDKLRDEQHKLEEEKVTLQKVKEGIAARVIGNKRALDSIQSKLSFKLKLDEEYGVLKDLDNVTRGNNKEHFVFEHYVLATYFEDIIQSANLRLSVMTNSRYELQKVSKVSDARTKDSLDLEVLDNYTGKKRSVKTLSGGESFKAALSLALGLSDIVQNNAGGIQIDTLFIDEGFGSLDSESLDQALKTLTSLTEQNKMIGIISHVSELKERIHHQIIVEKGNVGSKLKVIH